MENTLVWDTLKSLPKPAMRALEDFGVPGRWDKHPALIRLYRLLLKHCRDKEPPQREWLHERAYSGVPYRSERFRQALHEITNHIRNFLVLQALKEEQVQYHILLSKALQALDANHHARNALQDAVAFHQSVMHRSPLWYERQFNLQGLILRDNAGGVRTRELQFQELSDHLETAFLLQKLKLSCEMLSHQAVYSTAYDLGLLTHLLEYVSSKSPFKSHAGIQVYYHCCLALLRPGEEAHFNSLKPLLLEVDHIFPPDECRDLMLLTLNYCIRKLNEGQTVFAEEGLQLYAHALDKGYLLENGTLSRFTFRNVVGMGLRIQAFEWVEKFIHQYNGMLPVAHRESTVNLSMARLAYTRGDYREAERLLRQSEFDDLLLSLAAKTMMLKIYYESGQYRLLDASLDAFKIFLRRKKIIGYHRENYRNLVRYFEKMIALNPFDSAARLALRQAIESQDQLTEREWFLQQLDLRAPDEKKDRPLHG